MLFLRNTLPQMDVEVTYYQSILKDLPAEVNW